MPGDRGVDPIVGGSLRERRRGLVGWSAGLVVLVAIQMAVYPTIRDSEAGWEAAVDSLPEVFREIFRITDYTSDAGYLSTELLSFLVPFVFVALGASWGSRLTSEDEESGVADIVLSLPITRSRYVASRCGAAVSAVCLVGTAFVAALAAGGRVLGMSIPLVRFAHVGAVEITVGIFFMAIAALAGALSGHRAVAMAVSVATGVAAFVLYSLAPLVDVLDRLEGANPWAWTVGTDPLGSGVDAAGIVGALGLAALMLVATWQVFLRRDIRG